YGGDALQLPFLREVQPALDWPKLVPGTTLRLQTDPRLLAGIPRRFVVAITPDHPQVGIEASIGRQDGLPDALVYVATAYGIIIESKVAAPLVDTQLDRHAASAR